jgi:hypothetical protein
VAALHADPWLFYMPITTLTALIKTNSPAIVGIRKNKHRIDNPLHQTSNSYKERNLWFGKNGTYTPAYKKYPPLWSSSCTDCHRKRKDKYILFLIKTTVVV